VQIVMRRHQRRHADRRDNVISDLSVSEWSPTQRALLSEPRLDGVTLIDGAPGSGKSRLAAEIASRTLSAGRSVLWLVPEATQVALAADVLRSITGVEPELVHSGASQGERPTSLIAPHASMRATLQSCSVRSRQHPSFLSVRRHPLRRSHGPNSKSGVM
jgi:primosomal protein N'